jgi:hypothetical protein
VSHSDGSVFDRSKVPVGEIAVYLVKVDTVIVSKFALEHHVVVYAIAEPTSQAKIVRIGLRNTEVVKKDPNFEPLLSGKRGAQACEDNAGDKNESTHPQARSPNQ